MSREAILALMKDTIKDIQARIVCSNHPKDKKGNALFAPLVLIAQRACDEILADIEKSVLERLIRCAEVVNKYAAGNCMMQSFVAFDALLKKFLAAGLITVETALSMSICTTRDHAFVMVEDLVCDPWVGFVGPLKESPYSKQKLSSYFAIGADWSCTIEGVPDEPSTLYTYTVVACGAGVPASVSRAFGMK